MSDPAQSDALAAEYVLGTLDFEERTQAQALLEIDPEFVAKVRLWERRLGELHLMVEPVDPDGKIWERIKAKMPPPPPPPPPTPEVKPAEPAAEPAPSAPAESTPLTSAPPAVEASGVDAMSPATPEPPPSFDPITATLPTAPTIPSPSGLPSLTPSVTPGVLPSSIASPASPASSVLPSSMARPMPSPSADDAPPSFLSVPLPGQATAPASAAAAVLTPSLPLSAPIEREGRAQGTRPGGAFWPVLAVLMTLVVVAFGGLIAAWRFAPEHVPPVLHPLELMRAAGIAVSAGPTRRPAPPESQFDE
jgi:hypothetical protein